MHAMRCEYSHCILGLQHQQRSHTCMMYVGNNKASIPHNIDMCVCVYVKLSNLYMDNSPNIYALDS